MKCLVTGGAGFIGSHIVDLLIKNNREVIVIDNLSSTNGSKRNIQNNLNNNGVILYNDDITNRDRMFEILKKEKPDYVFHLAAQISVSVSMKDPELDHRINVIGSKNIIDASIENNVKKIIFSGSVAIYGDDFKDRFKDVLSHDISELEKDASKEESEYRPFSPYAKNKLKVIEMLKSQDHVKWSALLYANVYGPRQDPYGEAGVVAIFCQEMIKNNTPSINGKGVCIRDFVFCKDVARANIQAMGGVFDEFFKADESRHEHSSGLGLNICKRIVEKHKGSICAESDGLGKGSSFIIRIPKKR